MTIEQDTAASLGHPTENPQGITTANYDYWPRTQEEKAAGLGVPMATTTVVEPTAAYPEGTPPDADAAWEMLKRLHTPVELVPEEARIDTNTANLAAGGSLDYDELRRLRNAL